MEVAKIVAGPDVKQLLEKFAFEPVGSKAGYFINSSPARWIKGSRITAGAQIKTEQSGSRRGY